jgi:multidrug efflux pump subunit AcrA (membrane-fusion protein)
MRLMKKAVIGGVVVLVVASAALGWYWWKRRNDKGTLRLPGVVEIQEVRLGSKIGGRVKEVYVAEGDVVEADRVLLEFDVPELRAQVEQQQARVAQAEADAEKAHNGSRQQEIDAAWSAALAAYERLLKAQNGFRPEEIQQVRDDLRFAEADLKLSEQEFAREEQLSRTASGKQADFDLARANLNRSKARRQAAQAKLDLYLAGTREEEKRESAAEFARTWSTFEMTAAGNRYEDIAAADGRAAEARGKLRELEANLAEREVKSPGKVVVEVLAVRKGDIVAPNQPILRVLGAADMWVKVYVPETEQGKIRRGQEVYVTVDAYPDKRFKGTVIQVASVSEFTPRNVQSADERKHQVFGVKIRVNDPEGVFKSGMAAEVVVPLRESLSGE